MCKTDGSSYSLLLIGQFLFKTANRQRSLFIITRKLIPFLNIIAINKCKISTAEIAKNYNLYGIGLGTG